MTPPECPYCHVPAVLSWRPSYAPGVPVRKRWDCPVPGCDARVGVHRDSPHSSPLGTLARAPLRALRMQVHDAFDPLWLQRPARFHSRSAAYRWLAEAMDLPAGAAHIAEFDEAACVRALTALNALDQDPPR